MQLDQPWAKFHLKSYSNRLLINFFDPKSWNQIESSWRNWLNLVRFISKSWFILKIDRIWSKMSKLIKKSSRFSSNLIYFQYKLTIFNWIINIKTIFWSFDWKWSKKDWNWLIIIKIRSKLDQNCNRWFDRVVEIWIGPKLTI